MRLIPERYEFLLPVAGYIFPWVGLIFSLQGSLSSLLYREIEYIQGNESVSFARNQNGDYANRWMVANYVGPYDYLDEKVPLSKSDDTPCHKYLFEKDIYMSWSLRLEIAAIVLVALSAYSTVLSWYLVIDWKRGRNSGAGGDRSYPIFLWVTLILLFLTSFVHLLPPFMLVRSPLLCHDITNIRDDSGIFDLLIVEPSCTHWAFGGYAYFLASFCWLAVIPTLLAFATSVDHYVSPMNPNPLEEEEIIAEEAIQLSEVVQNNDYSKHSLLLGSTPKCTASRTFCNGGDQVDEVEYIDTID